mgnify:CR=1 FL=1
MSRGLGDVYKRQGVEFGSYGQRTGIAFSGAEDFDLIEPDYDTDIVNVTTGEIGSFTDVLTRKQELEANPEKFRKVVLYDYFFNKAFDAFSNQGAPCDKKILIVGDSMTKALAPFFVLTFQNVKCLDAYSAKTTLTQQLVDEYQPDDFVYLTVERNQELFEDVETVVWRDEVPEKDG